MRNTARSAPRFRPDANFRRHIGIVTFPGAGPYELSGVIEIFSTANGEMRRRLGLGHDVYTVEVIAPVSGPLTLEMGLKVLPDRTIAEPPNAKVDTLIVCGGCYDPLMAALNDHALIAWLRKAALQARRVVSLCTGAFLLAEAGVFRGAVTTHWAHCETFVARYPHLKLQSDNIYVKQGNHYSSAGSAAAIDLALALVEEDVGRGIAMHVARRMVMFLKRAGGQSQFSQALMAQSAQPGTLNGVPEWILENLAKDLSVDVLAARAAMSPRNFARVFVAETGLTPAKYVERARIEKARELIEESRLPLARVFAAVGFANDRQMCRAFTRHLKVTPSDYLARFRRAAISAKKEPAHGEPVRRRA